MNFEQANQIVKIVEGGYQNHPSDRGNYNSQGKLIGTNWGISAPVLERYMKRVPSVADMKALTKEQAKEIYKRLYWDANNIEQYPAHLRLMIYDMYVNGGAAWVLRRAAKPLDLDNLKDLRRKYFQSLSTFPTFGKGWLTRLDRITQESKNFLANNPLPVALIIAAVVGIFF
jgi:lysozyme family protein